MISELSVREIVQNMSDSPSMAECQTEFLDEISSLDFTLRSKLETLYNSGVSEAVNRGFTVGVSVMGNPTLILLAQD